MKVTISQIKEMIKEIILDEKKKGGKKDACYHKVKSRYKVWPSAYASGALVKCRKVGAKNWGNSKKENTNHDYLRQLVEEEIAKLNEGDGEGLHKWFSRKGAKGSKSGWVDCNTCRKDKKTGRKKCKACGRESGEKRSKFPKCRPTPAACGERGDYGKKAKAGKKG